MAESGEPFGLLAAFRKRLAWRLGAVFALVLLTASGFVATVALAIQGRQLDARAESQVLATTSLAAVGVGAALQARDSRAVASAVASLKAEPGVLAVSVQSPTGRAIGGRAGDAPDPAYLAQQAAAARTQKAAVSSLRDGVVYAAKPMVRNGRVVGSVAVAYSLQSLAADKTAALAATLCALLFALAAGTFAVVLLLQRVADPLRDITEVAQQASLRRLGLRLEIRTGDEIEALARAFNRMMQRLDSSMKRIQRLAFVDAVTELPNRERFRQETEEAVKAAGADQGGAVLVLDLDRFQRFAETLGQASADELLAAAGERIAAAARAADRVVRLSTCETQPALLARWGGSEFAILLPDLPQPTEAGRFAQLVAAAFRQPFEISGHRITLGLSVGVALFPLDGDSAEKLMRCADLALSAARNAGGGRAAFYTRAMNQRAMERLSMEAEVRQALELGQIEAFFQGKVDLASGRICGAEALARWRHPERGLISPAVFIPAAEEAGLIAALGEAIMRDACRKAAGWLRRGVTMRIAVNVSPIQFGNERFCETVFAILSETGLPPSLLEVEVTESVAMTNPKRVAEMIEPLRRRGVRFAIDDFGTGHSSLAALSRLPFDVFKIDQSFVKGIGIDRHAPALIETILAMAGSLGYETVAEGVETADQARFLRRRGCTLAQGYLFGKPMASEEFESHARTWTTDASVLAVEPAAQPAPAAVAAR